MASLLCAGTNAVGAWVNGFLPTTERSFSAEMWVWREEGDGSSLLHGLESRSLTELEKQAFDDGQFVTTATDIVPFSFNITDGGRPELTVLRSASTGDVSVSLEGDYIIPSETWTHCAFSAGETSLQVYVNGTLAGSTNLSLQPRPFSGKAPRTVVATDFEGRLDDLIFWSTPLTSNLLARDARCFLSLPQTNLMAWYPISTAQDDISSSLPDRSGSQPSLQMGDLARIDTTSGMVGFAADSSYSYLHGFVYEPAGNRYNINWYDSGKGEIEESTAPIFAVGEGLLNIWWRYGWKPFTNSVNRIYIPSVSQTFTNALPRNMAQIVLASGLGSATTSLVEQSSALLVGSATNAGVLLDTPIALANDFSVELWFKLPARTSNDCGILSLSHDTLKVYANYGDGVTNPNPAIIWQGDNGQKIVRYFPSSSLRYGEWNWLGLTKRANRMTLYTAQTNLAFSIPAPEAAAASRSSINRLGRPWYASRTLQTTEAACLFDEARIWNRSLTAGELAANRHRHFTGTESGLVSYMPFDTISGSLVYDAAAKKYFTLTDARLTTPGCPQEFSTTYPLSVMPEVYSQPLTNLPGFHPNDEHAFVSAVGANNVVMALRDDLSVINGDTQNIVLVQYDTEDGTTESKHMDVFSVVRTNELYTTFSSHAVAGQPLNGPSPLHLLPTPNNERTTCVAGPAWRDRRLAWWAVADTGTNGVSQSIGMQYYYPMQTNFWFPKLSAAQQPAAATPIPWLPEPAPLYSFITAADYPTQGTPILFSWSASWPESIPAMQVGQTLTKASGGLPELWNQSSVEVVWQTSTNRGQNESVILFDPTVARGVTVPQPLSYYGFTDANPAPTLRSYRGLTYFVNLPPDLGSRVYYDPNLASNNLIVAGEYVDNPAGTSYLLVNVLSSNQINEIAALVTASNRIDEWRAIVTNLYTTPALAQPSTPVDHFALAAQGRGAGYVTLAFANSTNPAMTAEGDPISLEIIRVETNLYLGSILPITDPINLISEQMNLLYTEGFAGSANDYDFNWHYAEETASGIINTNAMSDFPGGGTGKPACCLAAPAPVLMIRSTASSNCATAHAPAHPPPTWSVPTGPRSRMWPWRKAGSSARSMPSLRSNSACAISMKTPSKAPSV